MTDDLPPGFAEVFREIKEKSARVVKLHARPAWLKACIMSDGRKPVPLANLNNAMVGLENDPALQDAIGFDLFASKPVLFREVDGTELEVPRLTEDADVARIQRYLQQQGLKNLGHEVMHQALNTHAKTQRTFHPVINHLETLQWDGVPRIKTWLPVYAGTAMTDYELTIGPLFLISMIARVREPGCKADHMLVLEGEQGSLKSTLLKTLAEPWFSDELPHDIGSKDAKQHLRGKWLIEIGEMYQAGKADAAQLKSFLSRTEEWYRPPYGRLEVREPRQCVFCGTTNRATYLKDETGNRRFWPVRCLEPIQIDLMYRNRDQLLAEADHHYHQHAAWWPDAAFEREHIKPQQDERFETDEWQERIAEYLKGVTETTVTAVAVNALGYGDKIDRFGTREQRRISNILEVLQWGRGRRGTGGVRRWIPKDQSASQPVTNEINDLL